MTFEKIQQVKCPPPPFEWYKDLWRFLDKNLVLPIGVAVLAYWMTTFLGESKNRKNYSRLGVAIMESLIEEVRTGLNTLDRLNKYLQDSSTDNTRFNNLLPVRSWEGPQTVPNEVLLRILASSEGITAPFPPSEIRIHCKNYFSHICGNVNAMIQNLDNAILNSHSLLIRDSRIQLNGMLGTGEGQGNYMEATQKVLGMLEIVRDTLDKNSRKKMPK